MPQSAGVIHRVWITAPADIVRARFSQPDASVAPLVAFRARGPHAARGRAGRRGHGAPHRRVDAAALSIVIEVEGVEVIRHQRLRGRSLGPLDGEGLWLLRAEPGFTDVTRVWRLRLKRPWMRWFAALLAPVVRRKHAGVMRAGEAGLRCLLEKASAPGTRAPSGGAG